MTAPLTTVARPEAGSSPCPRGLRRRLWPRKVSAEAGGRTLLQEKLRRLFRDTGDWKALVNDMTQRWVQELQASEEVACVN